jgi:hypothetical protein
MKKLLLLLALLAFSNESFSQKLVFNDVTTSFEAFQSNEPFEKVFTSQRQFFQFCEEYKINPPANFVFPNVDFSKNYLVFICSGVHRTGGTELEINKMSKGKSGLLINFTIRNPQPGCPVTDAITYPIRVATVKRFSGLGKPRFSKKVVLVPCI